MTTVAIDINTLNELFENQSKLDDIFDSFFDEESFLGSSMSNNNQKSESSAQINSQEVDYNDDLLFAKDMGFAQEKRSITSIVMPVVLEIVTIYYCFTYFN